MRPDHKEEAAWTRVWIAIGSALFLIAMLVSAIAVPQLRLLHLLQALIYVIVFMYGRRDNSYALGAGFTIAAAWNSIETFGPHLVQTGAIMIWSFIHHGRAEHLDTMMVPVGAVGHLILMAACFAALVYHVHSDKKWWKFAAGGLSVLGYFALIIAIARPR